MIDSHNESFEIPAFDKESRKTGVDMKKKKGGGGKKKEGKKVSCVSILDEAKLSCEMDVWEKLSEK